MDLQYWESSSILTTPNPNQEPLSVIDDKVWEMHWPGAHSKRSLAAKVDSSMALDEVEEQQIEYDHALNVRSLSYGFSKLAEMNNNVEKRTPHNNKCPLNLNVGAFIRKAIRNGANKHMSTYWSYMGSLTTPG